MEITRYIYNGRSWRPSPTVSDYNSFFHAAFGTRTDDSMENFDELAEFRRMRWSTFLTYFKNENMPYCLANALRQCFSANDKFEDVPSKFRQNLTKYISDLTAGEKAVSKEDIPILATLENCKVVILSSAGPHRVIVIEPNLNILGSYTKIPKEKPKEVVLCLIERIFTKLELVSNEGDKNKVKKTNYGICDSARSKRMEYQISLLVMVILKAMRIFKEWKVTTEHEETDKFQDIVLEWSKGAVLIKFKQKKGERKVTLNELTSTNSKNGNFSLPQYFLSYMLMKDTFNVKNIIACTNAGVRNEVLKFLNKKTTNTESLLYYEDGECSFYTFNDTILPVLKAKTIQYYNQNFKNKGIQESVITEKNLMDFLNKLQLYLNYPPLNEVLEMTTEKLPFFMESCSNLKSRVSISEIYSKVMNWFQQKKGESFTQIRTKAMFAEIWTDKYGQKLQNYNVSFQKKISNFYGPKQIFVVTSSHGSLLQIIKVYYSMQNQKILFINPDHDINTHKQILEAFTLKEYDFLIIYQLKVIEESVIKEMCTKLRVILSEQKHKKVILMTKNTDAYLRCIAHGAGDYEIIDECVTFADLSKNSKEKLLKKKSIVFQGKYVCLEELLTTQTSEDYARAVDLDILENIITGEVKVGAPPLHMDKNIARFYINRTFKRSMENIHEKDIYDVKEKVVLVSDSAGVGKTTVLSKLATDIKERNPHLWVIKIALTEYTQFLRDLKNSAESISIIKLLNSKKSTKLTNHLERFVFSIEEKVVLMLDGVDEISPDYTKLVHKLITQCLQATNFAKIFVTTRPHMVQTLKNLLKVEPFELQPFAERNQVDFLTAYWTHKLNIPHENKEECEKYVKALTERMPSWTKNWRYGEDKFTATALHLRMLAEVFQENVKLNKSLFIVVKKNI